MAKSTKQASAGSQRGDESKQQGGRQKGKTLPGTAASSGGSAIAALKEDHRRVEGLFSEFESATDEERKLELVSLICSELNIHTRLEEEIFYPACRAAIGDDEILDEAQVEHDAAKLLIADLSAGAGGDDSYRDAKVKLLSEQIRHHVAEEEKPGEGILAKAEQHNVDGVPLATRLAERKQELQRRAASLKPTRAVSFNLDVSNLMEEPMPRYSDEGRDERGRFTSDRGGYRSRGRYDDDDDDRRGRGRGGWFGDSEGHSRAARERWEDDDDRRGSRSRGRYDEDDDDRGGRGRGGWFGDSEGHSRAARERWEDDDRRGYRSRSRYEDEDDDRGGYRSRGRYDDDDDDRGGRGRSHGGWFGDSEGHSRAAREGWDDRRGSGGGSRSRSRYDDDEDGRGWHGDPRGHAEAARRGWAHRR